MTVMEVSVTIDRSSLSLDDLVITNDSSEDLWIEDFTSPGFGFRYRYAPDSDYQAGSRLLSAVLDAATLPLVIYARRDTTANLVSTKAEVEAALAQFSYDVTLTVDGEDATWAADPVWPQWAGDSGMAEAFMAKTAVAIPINPPGA